MTGKYKVVNIFFLVLLPWCNSGHASDGLLEINHACAVNGGCFSGDTAGYPITIDGSAGKSYLLTGDLVVPDDDTDGIYINAPRVSIDLGGFEIISTACLATPNISCRPESGTGSGITAPTGIATAAPSVSNGNVTGMGLNGLTLSAGAIVSNVRAVWNRSNGISIFTGLITNSLANQNSQSGIIAAGQSKISGNTVVLNGTHGIMASSDSIIIDNQAVRNTSDGINAGSNALVRGNYAYANSGNGISVNCTSSVLDNLVIGNLAWGLFPCSSAVYRGNNIQQNTTGAVNDGINQGHNYCSGNNVGSADCP